MKKRLLLLLCMWVAVVSVTAQNAQYPFPQNVTYPYGHMPATFSTEDFEKWYSSFKSGNFMQSCNGGIAPRTDNGTKVEAMGWSMIMAAYLADKELFDGLYTFYKSKIQSHGMMAWLTSCGGVSDAGSASDGDLDVAFSLVVASWQWGESYKEEAIEVITTVKKLITDCEGTSVIVGGYGSSGGNPYGGCSRTDISYYTPAFFREFAKLTDDPDWEKLADDTYTVLNNGANSQTGLVPDWQTWQGAPSGGYGYDACRVPWRMALDYLWNGNEEAKAWCSKVTDWSYGVGPENIKSNYSLNGSGSGWPGMSYLGGFAVASMVHSQEAADAFGAQVAKTNFDSYWYHAYLGVVYMMTMSGNMWRPELDGVSKKESADISRGSGAFTAKISGRRKLVLSGIRKGAVVQLTTPGGKLVGHSFLLNGNNASMDVSSMKSGCYIVSIHDGNGKALEGRVISIY